MNWRYPLIGAVAFVGFHETLGAAWQTWFDSGSGHSPWFLNTFDAVLAAAIVFFIIGLITSLLIPASRVEEASLGACQLVAGATVPMIATLATLPEGPGSLAPLVVAVGIVVLLVPSVAGALAGFAARRFLTVPERT
jgi:hypothetical protein